jgi:hypothetical protein
VHGPGSSSEPGPNCQQATLISREHSLIAHLICFLIGSRGCLRIPEWQVERIFNLGQLNQIARKENIMPQTRTPSNPGAAPETPLTSIPPLGVRPIVHLPVVTAPPVSGRIPVDTPPPGRTLGSRPPVATPPVVAQPIIAQPIIAQPVVAQPTTTAPGAATTTVTLDSQGQGQGTFSTSKGPVVWTRSASGTVQAQGDGQTMTVTGQTQSDGSVQSHAVYALTGQAPYLTMDLSGSAAQNQVVFSMSAGSNQLTFTITNINATGTTGAATLSGTWNGTSVHWNGTVDLTSNPLVNRPAVGWPAGAFASELTQAGFFTPFSNALVTGLAAPQTTSAGYYIVGKDTAGSVIGRAVSWCAGGAVAGLGGAPGTLGTTVALGCVGGAVGSLGSDFASWVFSSDNTPPPTPGNGSQSNPTPDNGPQNQTSPPDDTGTVNPPDDQGTVDPPVDPGGTVDFGDGTGIGTNGGGVSTMSGGDDGGGGGGNSGYLEHEGTTATYEDK